VDGISTKVKGLEPHPAGVLGNYLFLNAWLARRGDMTTVAERRGETREVPPVVAVPGTGGLAGALLALSWLPC
jgi:hypothetical protein